VDLFDELLDLLKKAGDGKHFPRTLLYKEGWMLRLILSYLSKGCEFDPLTFCMNSTWYSEAQLSTPFRKRTKIELQAEFKDELNPRDELFENNTHADGVIGQFHFRKFTKTGLELEKNATQFIVLEAKIFSGLTPYVTNADFYDQASRNVACIAETLKLSGVMPNFLKSAGFYVVAPEERRYLFSEYLEKEHIISTVTKRIEQYENKNRYNDLVVLKDWYDDWFHPLLDNSCFKVGFLSWEEIINELQGIDTESLQSFYDLTKKYNQPRKKH
jgi:hypothetical protein